MELDVVNVLTQHDASVQSCDWVSMGLKHTAVRRYRPRCATFYAVSEQTGTTSTTSILMVNGI